MLEPCAATREVAAEIVRGAPGAAEARERLERHAADCDECSRVAAGARLLGGALSAWKVAEAPADLVARTLARVRLADALAAREPGLETPAPRTASGPATAPAANVTGATASVTAALTLGASAPASVTAASTLGASAPASATAALRRRSSVELLATWALPGPRPAEPLAPAARSRLGLRLVIQAAAAVLLFALCTGFTATFYPVLVQALEDSHVHACQERLEQLSRALLRYRHDHPDAASDPRGSYALRDALVSGGYARDEDFVCPSARGGARGVLTFHLRLPTLESGTRTVLAYDHLGNHGDGLNVVFASGKAEHVEAERLGELLSR